MVNTFTLFTTIFVLVDDWHQQQGVYFVRNKPGPAVTFSDSEVLILLLAMDYYHYQRKQQFLGLMPVNYYLIREKFFETLAR